MKYTCKFSLFGKKHYKFTEGKMGICIDKYPKFIGLTCTDETGMHLCYSTLGHSKDLKGAEYIVEFEKDDRARIRVGELQILIDFTQKKCASSNNSLKFWGADRYDWGLDVGVDWGEL